MLDGIAAFVAVDAADDDDGGDHHDCKQIATELWKLLMLLIRIRRRRRLRLARVERLMKDNPSAGWADNYIFSVYVCVLA